jgi:hypothetical protein
MRSWTPTQPVISLMNVWEACEDSRHSHSLFRYGCFQDHALESLLIRAMYLKLILTFSYAFKASSRSSRIDTVSSNNQRGVFLIFFQSERCLSYFFPIREVSFWVFFVFLFLGFKYPISDCLTSPIVLTPLILNTEVNVQGILTPSRECSLSFGLLTTPKPSSKPLQSFCVS